MKSLAPLTTMSIPKVWLSKFYSLIIVVRSPNTSTKVTGASSGLGRGVTEEVLRRGDIAVATLRSPSALDDLKATHHGHERLLVLQCDVTKHEDVVTAFAETIAKYGRCDVVYNNAGTAVLSEAENRAQDNIAREVIEVNFWGAMDVSREAVRVFRDLNPPGSGGRLLNVSSSLGLVGYPLVSAVAAR